MFNIGLYGWKNKTEVHVQRRKRCAGKHRQRKMRDRAHHFVRPVIFVLSFALTFKKKIGILIEARGYSPSQIEMTKIETNLKTALAYKYQKNSREQNKYLQTQHS